MFTHQMLLSKPAAAAGGDQLIYTPEPTFAGWTSRWHTASFVYNSGPPPAMRVGSATDRNFISLDEVDGVDLTSVGDVEVLLEIDFGNRFQTDIRFGFRGSGDSTTENAMFGRISGGDVGIFAYNSGTYEFNSGVPTGIDTNGNYYWKINVYEDGLNVNIDQKIWKIEDSEPVAATYTGTKTLADFPAGWIGVVAFDGAESDEGEFIHIGIGLNGQSAPFPA